MEVILHIGCHRSGTTTLQRLLQGHAPALWSRERVAVWTLPRTRTGLFRGLIRARAAMTPEFRERGQRSTGRMRAEMARLEALGCRQLLVSEENMLGGLWQNLGTGLLYPEAEFRLGRFAPAFADRCRRVVIGLRAQPDYWASAIAQTLPGGLEPPAPASRAGIARGARGWRHVLEEVARVFPAAELRVWRYEDWGGRPDLQLAAALGREGELPFYPAGGWHNRSLSADALRQLLAERGAWTARAAIPPGAGRWQPFTPADHARLTAEYRRDLAWLHAGGQDCAQLISGRSPAAGSEPQEGSAHEREHQEMEGNS